MDKDQRFILQPEAIRMVEGSSKGAQPKYYENGYWYKLDQKGYEGLSEYLISLVLKHSLEENIARVKGKPFCASQELQAYHAGFGLSLDYDGLYRELAGEKESRALRVLKRQLEACRKLIPEKRRDEKKNGKEGKEV